MQALLERREAESLTFQELSEQSGIPIPTLSYWAGKFRREAAELNGELVPVQLGDSRKGRPLRIDVGEGLELRVERDFNGEDLHRLITALISSC